MKRKLALALALTTALSLLAGCTKYEGDSTLPTAQPLPSFTLIEPDEPTGTGTNAATGTDVNLGSGTDAPQPTDDSVITTTPDGNPDPKETPLPEDMSYKKDFARYAEKNSDVIGWLDVPNTKIHYPVVIGKDNDYYLQRNYDKEASKSGTIFMDYRNADPRNFGHLIIYGHNMKNGTMFASLDSYSVESFFKKNKTITFYWNGDKTEWEVFAAFTATGSALDSTAEDFILRTKFNSNAEVAEYAEMMKKKSKFDSGVKVKDGDQILSLVTCAYEYDLKVRFVVMAHRK